MHPGDIVGLPNYWITDGQRLGTLVGGNWQSRLATAPEVVASERTRRLTAGYLELGIVPADVVAGAQPARSNDPGSSLMNAISVPIAGILNRHPIGVATPLVPLALAEIAFLGVCHKLACNAEARRRAPSLSPRLPGAEVLAPLTQRLITEGAAVAPELPALLRATEVPDLVALAMRLEAEAIITDVLKDADDGTTVPSPERRQRCAL